MTSIKTHFSLVLDSAAFVGYAPAEKEIVVVFRGITDLRNWISDMHLKQTSYSDCSDCLVHKSFYQQFNELAFFVRDAVLQLRKAFPGSTIAVTGHSLGSALAVFTALDLGHFFPNVNKVYTFGMPRVGNPPFAQYVA
jgi:predicted lipase